MTPHKDYFLDPPPAPTTPTLPPSPVLSEALQICHPHAAGIDIGEAEHWVAVPPGGDPQPVRRFGTFTADLDALADWLIDCGVTTVAMESTGVYWIPLFELLEARGVQVLLIDPRQAKRAPGRPKTDRLDCKWLQRFCQVVEAEALIRRASASPQTYLSFRRPAPYLSLRPNSRIDSASLDDSRPLIANAVWVGSVGQWAHRQTENAGHAPGI
jgi:Transposase